jgi:hypothetical protein
MVAELRGGVDHASARPHPKFRRDQVRWVGPAPSSASRNAGTFATSSRALHRVQCSPGTYDAAPIAASQRRRHRPGLRFLDLGAIPGLKTAPRPENSGPRPASFPGLGVLSRWQMVKVAASSDTSAYLANSAPREHTVRTVHKIRLPTVRMYKMLCTGRPLYVELCVRDREIMRPVCRDAAGLRA